MSDTPKTDALAKRYEQLHVGRGEVWELARQLERELADSRQWNDDYTRVIGETQEKLRQAENALTGATMACTGYQHAAEEGRADRARLDWLEGIAVDSKWADFCPAIRPRDPQEHYAISKYVGEDGWTLRKAIDAASERQSLPGGEGA